MRPKSPTLILDHHISKNPRYLTSIFKILGFTEYFFKRLSQMIAVKH